MKHMFVFVVGVLLSSLCSGALERPASPDEIFGPLFVDVQRAAVFPDQKTFVDCVPKQAPEEILAQYDATKTQEGFDLGFGS